MLKIKWLFVLKRMFLWTIFNLLIWLFISYVFTREITKLNVLFGTLNGLTIGFILALGNWRKHLNS
jgi:hypothetical protein